MEGWTDFLPMALFVAVELLLRLIEKIPDRPKQKAETEKAEADVLDKSSEAVVRYIEQIGDLQHQLDRARAERDEARAERDAARARLARCKCGEGEG